MRKLYALTFLLVLLSGLTLLLALRYTPARKDPGRRAFSPFARPVSGGAEAAREPPLRLPAAAEASRAPQKSWEYSGTFAANFVSARGQLVSWIQNQGWRPEKQITLDESREPRVILTFSRGQFELILMLWKVSTDCTG